MSYFFEIILYAKDFEFDGRDEVEDPLDEALEASGLGEVTGGGTGMGTSNIDVEVTDVDAGLTMIRKVLRELAVAPSTQIVQREPETITHSVYEVD